MVDAEQIYQKSNLASAGMKHLETLTEQLQTTLMQMQEQIKAAPEDKELEQRLQTQLFSMQGTMDTAQRAVAERVNKHFEEAVETYRKQQNLELVLPKQLVIAVRPDADITQKVIDIMNTKTADFSDITLTQESKAPETNAPETNTPGNGTETPK
ncbi:MAG: OmpH family outer membrane protein, partial [Deltaproteobacteria bacterium]|jgi:Skp family chaperone for outer membrane proteins|nr:OmpH family outer membrane protein [Deltaproteobacteria bacterium]